MRSILNRNKKDIHFSKQTEQLTFNEKRTFSNENIDHSDDENDENTKLFHKSKSYSELNHDTSGFNSRINTPLPASELDDAFSIRSPNTFHFSSSFNRSLSQFKTRLYSHLPTKHVNYLSNKLCEHSAHFEHLKLLVLLVYCLGCVLILCLSHEGRSNQYLQTTLLSHSSNQLECLNYMSNDDDTSSSRFYRLEVDGPFVDINERNSYNEITESFLQIDAYSLRNNTNILSTWTLYVTNPFENSNIYKDNYISKKNFKFDQSIAQDELLFKIYSNNKNSIAINFNCFRLSSQSDNAIIYAALLLVFIYTLIIFELIHRALAATLGAFGGIALLTLVESERPSLNTIVTWVEWETILLIFGMMLIVAIFCETGFFDLIAVRLFHYSGARVWLMIGLLCLLAAVLSAFLDNVTTVLLLTPITIRLCEVMNLDPTNIIIGEVIFSNIGGCATAIGDPPNVIITANSEINSKGVDFASFTLHLFIGSLFVYSVSFLHYRLLFWYPENFAKNAESEFDELNKEILLWTRTYESITPVTKEEKIVKTLLKEKVSQLETLLSQNVNKTKHEHNINLHTKSKDMVENYKINDMPLLMKCMIVFLITLVLFFIHPFLNTFHLTIGWISILSASILLVLSSTRAHETKHTSSESGELKTHNSHLSGVGFEALMHKVEWSTLLFFSGLFIFMKCIEELGLLNFVGEKISTLIRSFADQSDRLVIGLLLLTLLSALISSLIDNIPFTTAMIPIVLQLSEETNLPLKPLVYALAFGSCLGGNGSLIGASCNLVAAGILEQHGYKITFKKFFLTGFPIMLSSVLTALVYVSITCIYLDWY